MNLPEPRIDRETAMELWIKERSDYAKEQVVLNNTGMIGLILKQLNLNPFDEDLFSIGLIGVVKAVNTFDPDKGVKFTAYATPIIRNEILMTFRKKRIISVFSLDKPYQLGNGEEVSYADMIADNRQFEEDVIANMQVEQMVDFMNKNLSENEKRVISLKNRGKTQNQIAEICGLSQTQVSRIIAKACEKCKRKFN